MKVALLSLALVAFMAQPVPAGIERFVAADPASASPPKGGIRVTYLGVNGYQFEADTHALLVDPYFSRVDLLRIATNRPIAPDPARITAGLRQLQSRIAAVLVTHGHFDHLLDVPLIARRTGARIIGDSTAIHLARSLGAPAARTSIVHPGQRTTFGPFRITALPAKHDRLIGSQPPFPGMVANASAPPVKPSDYKLGQPLAFLIEANGQRVYIDSGGMPDLMPPVLSRIDLAILGVALPDSRRRFASAVRTLHPRFVLPSHQDDFFAPIERGFIFGKLTNFPALVRMHEQEHLPGRLILLDYFRPWTLR